MVEAFFSLYCKSVVWGTCVSMVLCVVYAHCV
jgi:hypothetical protein